MFGVYVFFVYLHHFSQYSLCFTCFALLNLINRFMTSTIEWFLKSRDIVKCKSLDISELFIQCNTYSYCERITGGVNIYLYGCVSLLSPRLCCVFVCVVCAISNQSTSKNPSDVSDLSRLDTLLLKTQQGPSGTKVPKLDMCWSIISLNKITHQMLRDHIFIQNNKATERAVEVKVRG